jgi:hypothetical protein
MESKEKATIHINPPPQDRRCECCGRHISELKPFGKAGDPLVGDFEGALLLRNFRTMIDSEAWSKEPIEVEFQRLYKLYGDKPEIYDKVMEELAKKFTPKEVENWEFGNQLTSTVGASWECRDCFILYGTEFYDKRDKRNECCYLCAGE